MSTVSSVRDEFANEFTEEIVTIDHNVDDKYDQEFSFHTVCHPRIGTDGTITVPREIEEYIDKISDSYSIRMLDMHVHIQVEISKEYLGIEEPTQRTAEGKL